VIHVVAEELLVAFVLALYATFVAVAMYDGLRNQVHFKSRRVTAAEIIGIVVVGAVIMAMGYDAVGAGITLGALVALGAMNLIYMSAQPPRPAVAAAHRTR
jgi:hypothetical protein